MSLYTASEYLTRITHVGDAPKNSYILPDMGGGLYYVDRDQYLQFSGVFNKTNPSDHNHLTMDLRSARSHSLCFDLDVKILRPDVVEDPSALVHDYLNSIFRVKMKMFLLNLIKNYTMIVATRENGVGLHIYFPEIRINNDDYEILCGELALVLHHRDLAEFKLDIPINMTLPRARKPGFDPYEPVRVYYTDEHAEHVLDLQHPGFPRLFDRMKDRTFKRRKENADSYFRKILYLNARDVKDQLYQWMMPVSTPHQPTHYFIYPTLISKDSEAANGNAIVANFTFKTDTPMFVHKEKQLRRIRNDYQRIYNFLEYNAFVMTDFHSDIAALLVWYERNRGPADDGDDGNNLFGHINRILKQENFNFSNTPNPIQTILQFRDGYYFLPVFYALCRVMRVDSRTLAGHLRALLDARFHDLLERLENVEPRIVDSISQEFTIQTILFCGANLKPKYIKTRELVKAIVRDSKNCILNVHTADQIIEILRKLVEMYFPMMVMKVPNSCKTSERFMWNMINDCWQKMPNQADVTHLVNSIWAEIQGYVERNTPPDDKEMFKLIKNINVNYVVASICTETNIDRRVVDMDGHKWHIRCEGGILDLLTGFVGGTVPEFYMSDHRLGIPFDRQLLMGFRDGRSHLLRTYHLLTTRCFFRSYLKNIFLDTTDDLLDTLRENVRERNLYEENSPLAESMYRFYLHLCKYMNFEYDRIMYMLDVVSSLLVSTNYERKFFVFKGDTRNGKSNFFAMIARLFGGYCLGIRSVNLTTTSGLTAQPELACSLFSRRVVTVEEMSGKLNEPVVKEITGNSTTSFRALYEQNAGGTPTAKLFAATNTFPSCTATMAFKDRVVAFPMESYFTDLAVPPRTSDQLRQGRYRMESKDRVVEDSLSGFFLMIYYHLMHHINGEDGMLHYRDEPESMVEFKEELLRLTDIYTQFKQHMDVQTMPGQILSFNDLRSAIRQFLKHTRNLSVPETDIIMKFEEEFTETKQIGMDDVVMGVTSPFLESQDPTFEFDHEGFENEEGASGGPSKRMKTMNPMTTMVFYRNVIIKNLKKDKSYY